MPACMRPQRQSSERTRFSAAQGTGRLSTRLLKKAALTCRGPCADTNEENESNQGQAGTTMIVLHKLKLLLLHQTDEQFAVKNAASA